MMRLKEAFDCATVTKSRNIVLLPAQRRFESANYASD